MDKNNKRAFIAAVSGIVLSLFLDKAVLGLIPYMKTSFLDTIFGFVTSSATIIIVICATTLLLFRYGEKRWMIFLWMSLAFSLLAAFALKLIILRPRPLDEIFYTFINIAKYSFPSAHAMAAFSLLPILNKMLPRLKLAWISFSCLFAFSRVYLNLHFFSDIVAGAFFGYFIGVLMIYLHNKSSHITWQEFRIILKELEFRRKAFHTIFGVLLVILLMFGIIGKIELVFLIIAVIMLSMLSKRYRLPIIYPMLTMFEREKNLKGFVAKGLLFYLIGALLVFMLFKLEIALASIMILAFGDSVSHIFGVKFGRTKHPFTDKKFLEGTVAGIIAGFFGALFFVQWHEALIASLLAMIAEGIEIKIGAEEIDDNLIIPIVAGAATWIMRLLY